MLRIDNKFLLLLCPTDQPEEVEEIWERVSHHTGATRAAGSPDWEIRGNQMWRIWVWKHISPQKFQYSKILRHIDCAKKCNLRYHNHQTKMSCCRMQNLLWPVNHYRKLIQGCCCVMWSLCSFALSQSCLYIIVIMSGAKKEFYNGPSSFPHFWFSHSWVILFCSSSHPPSSFLNFLQLSFFFCFPSPSPAREPTPAGGQHALGAGERRLGARTSQQQDRPEKRPRQRKLKGKRGFVGRLSGGA